MKAVTKKYTYTLLSTFLLITSLITIGCGASTSRVNIDWPSFIAFHGINYRMLDDDILSSDLIDGVFDTIKFKLEGNIHNLDYQVKDGDAAYLDPGTKIYTVRGYGSSFRLADPAGHYYDAYDNPQARDGKDLLDIENKVTSIRVDKLDHSQVGVIQDTNKINTLVNFILQAPVKQDRNEKIKSQKRYELVLDLQDGSKVTRVLYVDIQEIDWGIHITEDFINSLESILNTKL